MATKYEWTAFDYASQQAAAKIIADSGYSYRAISDLMNNAVSHVRISDIEKGRKAPIKLSEFLLLCQACEVDPVTTLKEIIETAREYESRERESRITDDLIEPRFENLPPQELAASRDMNRNLEAETPDE
ncbi:hypothetical protein [Bifidobacterium adolescentis]|jgi:transcriptional regulator with XRE-family HTH domain|uniref:hypothetical protein n=1 Tax=Bifidobacterium adolescentis TaxID=1680 RepID=UPI0020B687E4|nr:hypothetical protein [Bifidobacterium adolescentis]